ncbi:hypothetical protein, partial [Limnobacter sp.]|uniref:hypothetical protein n=1 Tax=Limnobacter sp. TaxID=2003368 RepID=UPI0027335CBA
MFFPSTVSDFPPRGTSAPDCPDVEDSDGSDGFGGFETSDSVVPLDCRSEDLTPLITNLLSLEPLKSF